MSEIEEIPIRDCGIEKPCPFCGEDADFAIDGVEDESSHYGICTNPDCMATGPFGDTQQDAVDKWNKRPEIEQIREMVAYALDVPSVEIDAIMGKCAHPHLTWLIPYNDKPAQWCCDLCGECFDADVPETEHEQDEEKGE